MGTAEGRKARIDARELATTMPADPYRGALTDPYTGRPTATPPLTSAGQPATNAGTGPATSAGAGPATSAGQPAANSGPPAANSGAGPGLGSVPDYSQLPAGTRTPAPAVLAGILALGLAAVLGLFGLLLLAIISLQDEYGAPDRSFYRGSDSNYLLLALLNFALGVGLAIGGISFLTGRLAGRLLITIAGWAVLVVCGFWWLLASVTAVVPLVLAAASLGMLALAYQASVTRWLGVLPAAQPE